MQGIPVYAKEISLYAKETLEYVTTILANAKETEEKDPCKETDKYRKGYKIKEEATRIYDKKRMRMKKYILT